MLFRVLYVLALLCVFALAVPAGSTAGQAAQKSYTAADADKIVAAVVKAYGGRDALEAVKGIYMKGRVEALMRDDSGTYTRWFERDRKLRVELNYKSFKELRILNGKTGWRGENGTGVQKVTGFQYQSMVYQYKQLDLPRGLASGAYTVRLAGEAVLNGRRADILSVKDDEGPPMDAYIDTKDRHIVKIVGYFNIDGRYVDLTAEFSDFRKVGGTLMPYRVTNFSQGANIGVTTVSEYKLNVPMKESLFSP